MSNAEQDYYAEIVELRQELERVTTERDALAHWRRKYDELAAENTRLEWARDAAIELAAETDKVLMACMDTATEAGMREAQVLAERDAARAAAAAWKRSAKMWREAAAHYGSVSHEDLYQSVKGTALQRCKKIARLMYFWWCKG